MQAKAAKLSTSFHYSYSPLNFAVRTVLLQLSKCSHILHSVIDEMSVDFKVFIVSEQFTGANNMEGNINAQV